MRVDEQVVRLWRRIGLSCASCALEMDDKARSRAVSCQPTTVNVGRTGFGADFES